MPKDEMTAIHFWWEEELPNPQQYNQNTIRLSPEKLFVDVEIPSDMIIEHDSGGNTILTPEGFVYAHLKLQQAFQDVKKKYFTDNRNLDDILSDDDLDE